MNYFLKILIVCLVFAFAKANKAQAQQEIKGITTYTALTKFNMPKDSATDKAAENDPMVRKIMEQLEKGSTNTYELFFTAKESSYGKTVELAKPEAEKGTFSISLNASSGLGSTIYKNTANSTYLKQGNIMGKEFVVSGALKTYTWELQSESKKIGKYTCYKATYKPVDERIKEEKEVEKDAPTSILGSIAERDNTITAWYTPELPISNGPGEYQGLPGLILEVNTADTTILCTGIEMNPSKGFDLKQPKDGKKVTQAEFDEIEEKKNKEMQERFRGSGTKIQYFETGR